MNVVLWILQVLLGAFFVFHSTILLMPSPQLAQRGMAYVMALPVPLRIFAATAEGLAGIALVLPALFRVFTWLTPLAAAGLVLLMIGAAVFHLPRREYSNIGLNATLGVLSAIVAWGRFGPYHF